MKVLPFIYALIPGIGMGTRFRICIRLHEFYRKHQLYFLNSCLKAHMQAKYACEISCQASVSTRARFMHTVGVVIGEGVVIEDNVTIYSGVVLGRKDIDSEDDYPIIKKGSVLGSGCKVLGKIVVEENVSIGAGAVVITSCTHRGGVYVGVPARLIQ